MAVSWSTDGGDNWERALLSDTGPAGVYCLAVAPSNRNVVYAGGHVNYAGAVRRSTDFGRTWSETSAPAGRVYGLAVHPGDENTVYAAALDSCWKTTNGGTTWQRIGGGYYLSDICLFPGCPDTVIAGGRYGVVLSTDAGVTWQQFSQGLGNTAVACLRILEDDGAVKLYAGTGGGGVYVYSFLTGIGEWLPAAAAGRLMVSPNPAAPGQRLRLVAGVVPPEVVLFDCSGRLVERIRVHRSMTDTGELKLPSVTAGVYFLRFGYDREEVCTKLVVRN